MCQVSGVKDTVVQETACLCPGGTQFLEEFKVQALVSPLNANDLLPYLWGTDPRQQPGSLSIPGTRPQSACFSAILSLGAYNH